MIAEDIRRFAEDPPAWGDIPPETGLTRVLTDRYCVLLGPVAAFTTVSRLRLDPDDVAAVLAEVRDVVRGHGHVEATWWVGQSATPPDLVDRLLSHGLVSAEGHAAHEGHTTAMVLASEPPPEADVDVRRIVDLDEFRLAAAIGWDAFGTPAGERGEWEAQAEERFRAERAGFAPRVFLAWLDGEPVGRAASLVASDCPAALLLGGAVAPGARGRGVYRALVHARWMDAAASGIPALAVQAGAMSRPILERLGFLPVAEIEILLDPATLP